ncbi:hypothetical protein HS088_TW22G01033 [Tripterygium wilfordii]|uniref:C2 domain-containing protein n=1 Tax=Tripterygium wilfordii TaxID=458696 RepID=A0A7J7BZJ8_TRIWF|nr:synaptic defective enhancer 1-like [Tripterygium wilfordii]KAF5727340.1 hypothetical protein HS088_TW22G01033 [Tripterygium wilfordii]
MASQAPLDLEITVISAKHLKNVNWRNGDLKPYAVFYLDSSENRLATHSDDSGNTSPVWNERFTLPLTRPLHDSVLTLEIFHSRPSETSKPLVGTAKLPLSQLVDESDEVTNSVLTIELLRPSGRPHGKVRVKMALKERNMPAPCPDYSNVPQYSHYYSPAPPRTPPPIPARDYREFTRSPYCYGDQYSGNYSGYYSPQPPMPLRPLYHSASSYVAPSIPSAPVDLSSSNVPPPLPRTSNYGMPSGPSAPVDYSSSSSYDPKPPVPKFGGSTLAGALGGLSLNLNVEEGSVHEKEKTLEREGYDYGDYHRRDY